MPSRISGARERSSITTNETSSAIADGEEADRPARPPAVRARLDDRVDEHEQPGRDGDRAGDVARLGLLLADLVRDHAQREQSAAAMPIGRLMKKTQRHESVSVRTPPSSRPAAPPPAAIALQTPSAFVRSAPSAKVA